MKKRVTTLFLVGVLALFGAACGDDTVGGIEEDVEDIEQELDEEQSS